MTKEAEQLEKLKKIGIVQNNLDRYEKQWLMRYEELKAFIDNNKRRELKLGLVSEYITVDDHQFKQ